MRRGAPKMTRVRADFKWGANQRYGSKRRWRADGRDNLKKSLRRLNWKSRMRRLSGKRRWARSKTRSSLIAKAGPVLDGPPRLARPNKAPRRPLPDRGRQGETRQNAAIRDSFRSFRAWRRKEFQIG